MSFDQKDLARIALHGPIDRVGDDGKPVDLPGRHLPGAAFERHRVDIDPRHSVAQGRAIADFIQRIGPVDAFDRRRNQCVIDQALIGAIHLHDITLARDRDMRRWHIDEEPTCPARATPGVVDNDDVTTALIAPQTADQAPIVIGDRDDLRAIGTHRDGR